MLTPNRSLTLELAPNLRREAQAAPVAALAGLDTLVDQGLGRLESFRETARRPGQEISDLELGTPTSTQFNFGGIDLSAVTGPAREISLGLPAPATNPEVTLTAAPVEGSSLSLAEARQRLAVANRDRALGRDTRPAPVGAVAERILALSQNLAA